jgi:hypothetical protein
MRPPFFMETARRQHAGRATELRLVRGQAYFQSANALLARKLYFAIDRQRLPGLCHIEEHVPRLRIAAGSRKLSALRRMRPIVFGFLHAGLLSKPAALRHWTICRDPHTLASTKR